MSTMAISWVRMGAGIRVDGSPDHFIHTPVEREVITTSGTTARSTACPAGANCAIVAAIDAALIVNSGDDEVVASAALGVDVVVGAQAYIKATPGETYIAGIES